MENQLQQAEELLRANGQDHLIATMKKLTGAELESFLQQVLSIDFEPLNRLKQDLEHGHQDAAPSLQPIPALDNSQWSDKEKEAYAKEGWALLRTGRVGVIVVAGGQGSRLGHDGPKGTMDIGLPSGKSLFQIQAERLVYLSAQAGAYIPWYIMTSPDNHEETEAFFRDAGYFGYPEGEVFFFKQATMPAVDHTGKLLLAGPAEINFAASGNGECFASLSQSGGLADMKRRGLEWLFYYNVDNVLVKLADPAFIGAAASYKHPVATKVIEKKHPGEKVGMACLSNGRPSIVEYSEFPAALLEERKDGGLLYDLGNMSIHLFSLAFIEEHAATSIPYHAASKKIAYVDENGNQVKPEVPNAYKLERFIFDFFPLAEGMTVLKVKREEEFAPVKNKEGADSPATARQMLLDAHRSWLIAAGVSPEELADRDVEVSPLLSYAGEGLDEKTVKVLLDQA